MSGQSAAAYEDRARTLAAAANALNRAGRTQAPFRLAFLTDRRRGPDAVTIARALPVGAAIVTRDYDDPDRAAAARTLKSVADERGLVLIIGGDPDLARAVGAGGVHLRSDQLAAPLSRTGLIVSAACHSAADLERAAVIGADVALLSPVFETRSHPGGEVLGVDEFRRLAAISPIPVLALGGVDESNAGQLAGPNVAGFAAISAFAIRR